jgi:hypothetical protein
VLARWMKTELVWRPGAIPTLHRPISIFHQERWSAATRFRPTTKLRQG